MAAEHPPSELQISFSGGVLTVEGEVDLLTAPDFQQALVHAQEQAGDLLVDIRGVTFMDSTGLRALLEARRRAEERDLRIALDFEAGGPVGRLIDLAGVSELFSRPDAG